MSFDTGIQLVEWWKPAEEQLVTIAHNLGVCRKLSRSRITRKEYITFEQVYYEERFYLDWYIKAMKRKIKDKYCE